jgi:hypothetical protein
MTQSAQDTRLNALGQIQDLVGHVNYEKDPFLYYLPELLCKPEFALIDATKMLQFVTVALKPEKPPIMIDALKILNQIVNAEDGSLQTPAPNFFYDNQNFLWKELGGHERPVDVILHMVNKVLFVASVGQY